MLRPEVAALLTVTVLAFALIDLSTPWVLDTHAWHGSWENVVAGAMVGIIVGQISLIAAWSTFATQGAALRFWGALLLLIGISILLLVGFWWIGLVNDVTEMQAVVGGSVIVCCGTAQLPLWMAARLFGWRFVRDADVDGGRVGYKWQFRIKHVMVVTLLAAVLLAAWQWGVVEILPPRLHRAAYNISESVLLVFNPLVSLPWIWIVFQPRHRLLASASAGIVVIGIVTATQYWIVTPGGAFFSSFTLLQSMLNLFQCLTVAGVLLLFRWDGWRLSARSATG